MMLDKQKLGSNKFLAFFIILLFDKCTHFSLIATITVWSRRNDTLDGQNHRDCALHSAELFHTRQMVA